MEDKRHSAALVATVLLVGWSTGAFGASGGVAEVRVETSPPVASATLRFEGLPEGEVALEQDGTASLSADATEGRHASTLTWIDPELLGAGYRLAEIVCDDPASNRRSHGDLSQSTATFEVEDGEAVACTFRLAVGSACTCPREGRWHVDNHAGSMTCTGAMSMTMPLMPSRSRGTLTVNQDCSRAVAEGMTEDEADLEMALQPDCSWLGTVGGEQDGIPMTITFRWNVETEERITGNLESTVAHQGMACRMARTYELDFEN